MSLQYARVGGWWKEATKIERAKTGGALQVGRRRTEQMLRRKKKEVVFVFCCALLVPLHHAPCTMNHGGALWHTLRKQCIIGPSRELFVATNDVQ